MSVKLMAVDMDGTFLDDDKNYNQPRFLALYQQIKAQHLHFVVASGNQYSQLLSYFPGIQQEIAFIAENGAYIVDAGEEVFCGRFTAEEVRQVLDVLATFPEIDTVVCSKQGAWVHSSATDPVMERMSRHYRQLEKRDNLYSESETIFKFSLGVDNEQIPQLLAVLKNRLSHVVTPVCSGFGFIDLIIPGVHKAHGIKLLQQRWHIADHEILAIGDSGNDYEMIKHAGYGVAMGNAAPEILEAAEYKTQCNNQEGALNVIEQVINHQPPFV